MNNQEAPNLKTVYPNANFGWLFYKAYYRRLESENGNVGINFTKESNAIPKSNQQYIAGVNRLMTEATIMEYLSPIRQLNNKLSKGKTVCIPMRVDGRGLVTGTGINHELGITGEFKMGCTFDYFTGLPFVSGSSLKGAFRSHFSIDTKDDSYFSSLLAVAKIKLSKEKYLTFQKHLFEEKPPTGRPCQFIGACLSEKNNGADKIFRADVLTPHKADHTKKPVPLPFMTVNRGLLFNFYFELYNFSDQVVVEDIKRLFSTILKEEGIGSKKNYDFGIFEEE